MKRELKVGYIRGSRIGYISFRRCPYEEGTERQTRKKVMIFSLSFRRCPYEEGTESSQFVQIHGALHHVSDAVPMKRELKVIK